MVERAVDLRFEGSGGENGELGTPIILDRLGITAVRAADRNTRFLRHAGLGSVVAHAMISLELEAANKPVTEVVDEPLDEEVGDAS